MMLLTFDPNRPPAALGSSTAAPPEGFRAIVKWLERLCEEPNAKAEYDVATLVIRFLAGERVHPTKDALILAPLLHATPGYAPPPPSVKAEVVSDKYHALGTSHQRVIDNALDSLRYTTHPDEAERATPEYIERHARETVADLCAAVMTREQQIVCGTDLLQRAAHWQRRDHWMEPTIVPADQRAARIGAAQHAIAMMDDARQQHAADIVIGIAAYPENPKPIRNALARYIRDVLMLGELSHVLSVTGAHLARWAGAAGQERPDLPKAGRRRRVDRSSNGGTP